MRAGASRIEGQLTDVLRALKRGLPAQARQPRAVSALAEGSDRLFAIAALRTGYALEALLPFSAEDYRETFTDAADDAFDDLMSRAVSIDELPGSLNSTTDAYEAVGAALVTCCDILVSVWDGEGAAGRGGTPDIMQMAINTHKPIIWINAAQVLPTSIMHWKSASDQTSPELATLARSAHPASNSIISECSRNAHDSLQNFNIQGDE